MPLYACRCTECAATDTYVRTIDQRHDTPECRECGGETRQIITPVRGFGDLPEYESPIDGRVIRGRRARRYDLERSNSRPYEGLEVERREAERKRRERDQRVQSQLDEQIERTISDLDASNKLTRTGERSDQPYEPEGRTYG